MIQYALLVASMFEYGNPTVVFLTVPKLYTVEQCATDKPKLLDRLEHPHDGEKVNSNVRVECFPVPTEKVTLWVKNLELELKQNSQYLLYADHYRSLAIRFRGSKAFGVLPSLDLSSREVCNNFGRNDVRRLTGIKIGNDIIEEVFYNCVPMDASEAKEIVRSFKTGATPSIDTAR